jgi:hypothetical protein
VIRFAFKRLPGQDPLLEGNGEMAPEPDYDSEDWKGWERRLTKARAEEVVAIKQEENLDHKKLSADASLEKPREYILIEDD